MSKKDRFEVGVTSYRNRLGNVDAITILVIGREGERKAVIDKLEELAHNMAMFMKGDLDEL